MSTEHNTGLTDELDDEDKKMMTEVPEEPVAPVEEKPAAEEPAAASAEAKPAADDDDEDTVEIGEGVNKGRFIRHGAFHRERKMRQEMEKRSAEQQQQIERERIERARINERLELLLKATQPTPQDEQAKVPNPEENPFEYMRYLEGQIQQLGHASQGVAQEQESSRQYQTHQAAFMQDASRFSQQSPDFMNAYDHLMKSRDRELQLIGRSDPRERNQIIREEEFQIVAEAFRQNRSPAELFYALATDRGYQKAAAAAAAAPAPVVSPDGIPPAGSVPAIQPKPTAVEQVKQVVAAQQTAKSLSSAAGASSTPVTAQSLADMGEDEFLELYTKMPRDQRRQYFGG